MLSSLAKKLRLMLLLVVVASMSVACANFGYRMKSFLGGGEPANPNQVDLQKYSQQQSAGYQVKRQYRRMTRGRLEEESRLGGEIGSLWVMEGQGSYLASENTVRIVGDIVNVKIDGAPKRQLETKAAVITKLLQRLQARNNIARSTAAATKNGEGKNNQKLAKGDATKDNGGDKAGPSPDNAKVAEEDDENVGDSSFEVDIVPTRIAERLLDGNYRIKGTQAFMIGKKEYRVIVTGIARAQDLSDNGIDSSKLLDPQFDIVSKKGM